MKTWDYSREPIGENCILVDLGLRCINPRQIFCLSKPYERIRTENVSSNLRRSVEAYGWKDPSPQSLHIVRDPASGLYQVCSGGNHRAVLAYDLGLQEVPASVSYLVPYELLTSGELEAYERASGSEKLQLAIMMMIFLRLGWDIPKKYERPVRIR
ncbi:hypothetical protein [Paenibacillus pasadenensis]|uniref:hypothetical protein n=1 Tax=Paenibacillus pasadenensis TaxID=217090 RepID=UPI0011AEFDB9|nr:hypothetical protein [Paenibacillus pasadenensis]